MARIVKVEQLPLASLEIGRGQVRVSDVNKDVDLLVDSIRKQGQLEPIVVCEGSQPGKYEILTGQRRFLALTELGSDTVWAAILDERVDETTAKVISLSENLVRRDLNRKDLIDACTALYRKYGSIVMVAEETGLPYAKVSEYVKYDQLIPELKQLVDTGVDIKTALRAQKAAQVTGQINAEEAVELAKEMAGMSGVQQKKVVEEREESPDMSVEELIVAAKSTAKVTQIVVTLSDTIHDQLKKYAEDEGTSQDDAAASLIQDGLEDKGYLS